MKRWFIRNFYLCFLIIAVSNFITISYSYVFASQKFVFDIDSMEDIVDIKTINQSISINILYSTKNNFLKEDAYGDFHACYLRNGVADKLSIAQNILDKKKNGYSLLVYDCLRPRNVQYKMWEIVKGTKQQKYVANPANGSIHNYGAAVDLSIIDEKGIPLDMGTPFDFFGKLAQPRYEGKFLKEGKLTKKHINNRKLLREVMSKAGFKGLLSEWWHFNAYPNIEVKKKYEMVEFILPISKINDVLKEAEGLPRDENGYCMLIRGVEKKLYLIKNNSVKYVADIAIGQKGLGKTKEGDRKTPRGDYSVKWMLSRNGPAKKNPANVSSFVADGKSYCVLDTELYTGNLNEIRVKELSDGTRKVSNDIKDRAITKEEIKIAQDEKLWTNSYGGKNIYVIAIDYPNMKDKSYGKTGSCIEIHASANLEKKGYKKYKGTYGCVSMYPSYIERIYKYVNYGTPVRIIN